MSKQDGRIEGIGKLSAHRTDAATIDAAPHAIAGICLDASESEIYREEAKLIFVFSGEAIRLHWRDGADEPNEAAILSGQFCIIPPLVRHSVRWRHETERTVLLIRSSYFKKHVPSFVSNVVIADFKIISRHDDVLGTLAQELRRQVRNSESANPFFFTSLGEALACRTLEQYFSQAESFVLSTRLSPQVLRRVVDHIDTHIKEPLSVNQLAKIATLSAHHFSKLFKKTTGQSPMQYVLKLRVEMARTLLRTGDFRVSEVAHELGFYDQSHLDRHFRRFFGHPPKHLLR